MTPAERIAEIRKRCEAATPGPQYLDSGDVCALCHTSVSVAAGLEWEDGDLCHTCTLEFADQARDDIPWLLSQLEAVTKERDYVTDEYLNLCKFSNDFEQERDELKQLLTEANARVIPGERDTGDSIYEMLLEARAEAERLHVRLDGYTRQLDPLPWKKDKK